MTSTKNKNESYEILIVEDSPTQAIRLQGLLKESGYRVNVNVINLRTVVKPKKYFKLS